MELLKVDTLEEALEKLYNRFSFCYKPCELDEFTTQESDEVQTGILKREKVGLTEALGRVLAENVTCSENIPAFNRSTMDGYAVQSKDTMGAGESMPAFLEVIGEVEMGKAAGLKIEAGQCAYVPTGGMVPDGADAVAMIEHCQPFGANQMAVYDALSYGRNMVFAGDDVTAGQTVLERGHKIKPADMGLLASLGKTKIEVYKPWKIYIISTGDEIVEPQTSPNLGQMRDVNTYGLIGEVQNLGFEVSGFELVKDEYDLLLEAAKRGAQMSDIVLVSGGSSKGKKDVTAKVIDEVTDGGVFVHGLAVKPGKPTILGVPTGNSGKSQLKGKVATDNCNESQLDDSTTKIAQSLEIASLFIGLPGHPVAALLLFRIIVGGLWDNLTDRKEEKGRAIKAKLTTNLASSPGRKTFQLVKLSRAGEGLEGKDIRTASQKASEGLLVTPILGKSGLIRTMSDADGYIVMDTNDEGINKGEEAEVYLL